MTVGSLRPARLGAGAAAALVLMGVAAQGAEKIEPLRFEQGDERLRIEVVDLSPRFLAFFEAAREITDPARRFALWSERYGFAAVPPGPEGEAISRRLLDAAWPRYPEALPVIRAGARAMQPDALTTARKVAAVLKPERPVKIKVIAYVGGFDNNAFSFAQDGVPTVCVPLEMAPRDRELVFVHEMTHAMHISIAGLSGGWERTIGTTVFQEGLALHVVRETAPDREVREIVEVSDGWYDEVRRRHAPVLRGIVPDLAKKDGQTVFKYTMGSGNTGLEREAYYAGWVVVEHLRAKGRSLESLARIPEAEMPKVVGDAIAEIFAQRKV